MSEERSAKLKLKRKKCVSTAQVGQEAVVRLQPSSVLSLRQDFTGSWFDEIELTPAQQIWKQVLSSVYPDLSNMGWGAVPGLPDVNLKMNKKEKEMIKTEAFKVGNMNFEWFPLPTALTKDNAKKPFAPEIEASQQTIEHIMKPSPDALSENVQQSKSTMLLTKQVKFPVCCKDYKSNTMDIPTPQNSSTKNVVPAMSQKSTIENATKPRTLLKCFSRNVKEPQICKSSFKAAKGPQTLQKGSTRPSKEQQTSQKSNVNLWATVTSLKSNKTIQDPKGTVEPETEEKSNDVIMIDDAKETSAISNGGNSVKESVEKSADATSSLDNCPICLMQFPKQFSQLDMDSHLAQCLSETTVDVIW